MAAHLRVWRNSGAKEYRERAEKTINAFASILGRAPTALPQMLVAIDYSLGKPRQIVVAGEMEKAKKLLAEVRRHFLPTTMLLLADQGEGQKYLGEKIEAIRAMKRSRQPAATLRNFACNRR